MIPALVFMASTVASQSVHRSGQWAALGSSAGNTIKFNHAATAAHKRIKGFNHGVTRSFFHRVHRENSVKLCDPFSA